MIYLFTGDDTKNKRLAYEKFIKAIDKNTEIFPINRNNFDRMQIESLYSGSSLFFEKSAILFDNIFEYEETREFVLEKLGNMNDSQNSFIFLDSKLNKPILDAFQKANGGVNIFELPKKKKEKYNNFILANDFGAKDKLNLWIHFRQAMDLGVGMEELIGVLFWKMKDMIIKRDFKNISEDQLKNSASRLSYLLPEARHRGIDAEIAFEQFLLEVFLK
jgi:hypothetical protein